MTRTDPDKRPAVLAAALRVLFLVVLLTPATADYFSLLRPGGLEMPVVSASVADWFFSRRARWRHACRSACSVYADLTRRRDPARRSQPPDAAPVPCGRVG